MSQKEIIDYYVKSENAYIDAWGLHRNHQLNLGLWDKNTKSLGKAMQNLNVEMARLADVQKGSIILDAGCGVGGTSIFLATRHEAIVHGIGIVPRQIKQCRKNAQKAGATNVHYEVMDYSKTTFPDEFFDVVIGIESICHAESKADFLQEAYRIMKPGGRLVIADPMQRKTDLTKKERKTLYQDSFHGCAVWELWTAEQYKTELDRSGFDQIDYQDRTDDIRPSIRRLRRFYYPAWLYNQYRALIGKPFGKTKIANTRMCYYMLTALNKGLWSYGILRAVK